MKWLRYLNGILLAGFVWFAVSLWPHLPDRIPRHFGANGEVDAWVERSLGSWFALPAIAVFTVAVLEFSAWLVERRPQYINLPSKQQFLALPPHEQAPIAREVGIFVQGLATMMILVFATIQWATYQAARGISTRALMQFVLVATLLVGPILAVVMIARTSSQVEAARRRVKLRGG